MSYREITGNIFNSKASTLVNTVNCVGAMGKGIALEFRRRFPEMFKIYQQDCIEKKLQPGRIYSYQQPGVLILNFAIKDNWKYPSKIEWVDSCLKQFVTGYRQKDIRSIAFPWMGAMNGNIPLEKIQATTRKYLQNLPDIDVEVFGFDPDASDPLFEVLKRIACLGEPLLFLEQSGLQRKSFEIIMSAVKSAKVNSLARLVESGIVGDTSLDKLYIFLSNNQDILKKEPMIDSNPETKQLTLF
jgi:O-acetyl-ADP-ribose deacetylase (regulator of RNase III)